MNHQEDQCESKSCTKKDWIKCKESWILSKLTRTPFATSFRPFATYNVNMSNSSPPLVLSWWTKGGPIKLCPKINCDKMIRQPSYPIRTSYFPKRGRQEYDKRVQLWSITLYLEWLDLSHWTLHSWTLHSPTPPLPLPFLSPSWRNPLSWA